MPAEQTDASQLMGNGHRIALAVHQHHLARTPAVEPLQLAVPGSLPQEAAGKLVGNQGGVEVLQLLGLGLDFFLVHALESPVAVHSFCS